MKLTSSIDMVVMETVVKVSQLEPYLKGWEYRPEVEYWQGYGIKSHRHNYNFKVDRDSSFYVAVQHNSPKKYLSIIGGSVDIVVKYNPNKVSSVELARLLVTFFVDNPFTILKSFDLAIDIPINILSVFPQPTGKMGKRTFDNGGDNKTYYFKERGSNGSTKIYNKSREAGLDYDLTRYEITLVPKVPLRDMAFYSLDENLLIPLYITGDVQLGLEVTGTDKVLLLACLEHYEYLDELPRKKKAKIKELISNLLCQVDLEITPLNKTIRSFFSQL